MGYVLGLDLGTSSLKGLLINKSGEIVKTASANYPLIHPHSGYSEQDPNEWIQAAIKVMKELSETVDDFADKLEGISFSGQMHSLVLLDEDNEVLRNAILWNDVRTTKQSNEIMENFDELLSITKNRSLEGFTLPKILWVQQNEPEKWEQVRHILLPKDYLGHWMTEKHHMDYSDASGTLLLDLTSKEWSDSLLKEYNIPREYMPTLIESTGYIGDLKSDLASQFGLPEGIKVFSGAADNAAAAVGAGIMDEQSAMASIGTSGVFLTPEKTSEVNYEGQLHLFHHAQSDAYYSMGVTLAAGHSLNWFKDTFAPDMSYDELLKDLATIPAGADGLLFTPYIVGERTPYVDSQIRGSFLGIDTSHTLAHFAKAVIEGITFSLKDSQLLMQEVAKKEITQIVSLGGGAQNKDWLQIQANVFGTEVTSLVTEQGPGLGAAMLAAVGLGWFTDLEECAEAFVDYGESVYPQTEEVEKYKVLHEIYQEVYQDTKNISYKLQQLK